MLIVGSPPDLDGRLAEFLRKACASSRDERYSTAREMKEALDSLRQT